MALIHNYKQTCAYVCGSVCVWVSVSTLNVSIAHIDTWTHTQCRRGGQFLGKYKLVSRKWRGKFSCFEFPFRRCMHCAYHTHTHTHKPTSVHLWNSSLIRLTNTKTHFVASLAVPVQSSEIAQCSVFTFHCMKYCNVVCIGYSRGTTWGVCLCGRERESGGVGWEIHMAHTLNIRIESYRFVCPKMAKFQLNQITYYAILIIINITGVFRTVGMLRLDDINLVWQKTVSTGWHAYMLSDDVARDGTFNIMEDFQCESISSLIYSVCTTVRARNHTVVVSVENVFVWIIEMNVMWRILCAV